jgi:hypothetical protein
MPERLFFAQLLRRDDYEFVDGTWVLAADRDEARRSARDEFELKHGDVRGCLVQLRHVETGDPKVLEELFE